MQSQHFFTFNFGTVGDVRVDEGGVQLVQDGHALRLGAAVQLDDKLAVHTVVCVSEQQQQQQQVSFTVAMNSFKSIKETVQLGLLLRQRFFFPTKLMLTHLKTSSWFVAYLT